MAITATLVYAKANRLRYLIDVTTAAVQAVKITGADLVAASVAGPIKNIAKTLTQGYGKVPAGIPTVAQARALLLSDSAASIVGAGLPTAIARYTSTGTVSSACRVDAAFDGTDMYLNVQGSVITSGYLDLEIPGQIGA
jgi:hypothetical protein